MLLLLTACIFVIDKDPPPGTCEEVEDAFQDALADVQACTTDTQCGQVLHGTSCGCTRDLVARTDADASTIHTWMDAAGDQGCDLGLDSVCDCPQAWGFTCDAGTCAWDYAPGAWLPSCRAERGDPYQLDDLAVAGDTLLVTVSYGGGCEAHDWDLCWPDGVFAENDPVQASLDVWHDGHDDACDAWLTEEVPLDLQPLQDAWHEAYGSGAGSIVVRVGDLHALYRFGS